MNKSMDPILKAVSAILKDERKLTLEQIDGARTELLDMIAEVQKVEGPKGEPGDGGCGAGSRCQADHGTP